MTFFSQGVLLWILAGVGGLSITLYVVRKTKWFFGKYGRFLVDAVFWGAERFAGPKVRSQVSMKRYCQVWLDADATKYLQVPGKRNVSLPVDEVFVPLSLEVAGNETTYTHATLLDAGRRLLVVGDPGSGKSTLVLWLFRDMCGQARRHPRKWWLPVRLELRTLDPPEAFQSDAEAGEWLLDRVRGTVTAVEGFEMAAFFDSVVSGTGVLVLLDGLDEVSRERYPAVASGLRGLAALLAGRSSWNTMIVTMRSQFYQEVQYDLGGSFPQTLHVRPFTPNEIYVFLRKWPFEKRSEVERVYADLSDRPTLREMCTNPLVLAMYVVYHRESRREELPDTRTEFYRSVVTELLITRRRRQTGDDLGRRRRAEREAILGELAYSNLTDDTQPANSLSWDQAVKVAGRVWQCDEVDAWRRLKELSTETGIFTMERPDETFRFIHLTFCEFLAAVHAVEYKRRGWRALLDRHQVFVASGEPQARARLVETIPFAHGLMRAVDRPEVLATIAALGDQLVLGRCFLETQMYDRPEWERYFAAEKAYLTSRAEQDWNTPQLSRLQLFTVVVRDQLAWTGLGERETRLAQLFASIVKDNRGVLVRVFSSYAKQDATAAFRLADHVGVDMLEEHPQLLVGCCQDDAFLNLAVQRLEAGRDERWRPILAEASLLYTMAAKALSDIEARNPWPVKDPMQRRVSRVVRLTEETSMYVVCLERTLLAAPAGEFPAVDLVRANLRPLARAAQVAGATAGTSVVLVVASIALLVASRVFDWALGLTWTGCAGIPLGFVIGYFSVRLDDRLRYLMRRPLSGVDIQRVIRQPYLFSRMTTLDRAVRSMATLRGEWNAARDRAS
ncbi:NACHT domain-containing protein [Actinokineospora diospyrosa]|uniref:NACHT domain-containing protein n=1 Tax=Actinokineospora diospyrosa TaxID=103728 RepID=A0ABT1I6D2_9PSEU|nr:NACHT domain-containing protein [Actinokineospora diospyrosa]MCP2268158.1 NACHT domain-containing protein [Actinokineospora diospyrosa]